MKATRKYSVSAVVVILLITLVVYALARIGAKELNATERNALGGTYLQTANGVLSYTREGEAAAPVVILVHGFSTPKFVWEQITPYLLEAGYQVVAYDHFGRGFSDRPSGPYDAGLYRSELSALIDGLDLSTPLTLVGYSMGGANVVDYAAEYPQQIKQLILIAPAGYMRNADASHILLAPIIGEWLFSVLGKYFAYSSIETEVATGRAPADMLQKFEAQAAYAGYTDALLSTLRHFPMTDLAHRYRLINQTTIPVTAIWGTEDRIVPYDGAALMAQDLPKLKLTTIEGADHNMTFGQAEVIATALIEALGHP